MGKFIIEKKVWDKIPNLAVGVLVLKNVQENKELSETDLDGDGVIKRFLKMFK